jgi:hypothetical protein
MVLGEVYIVVYLEPDQGAYSARRWSVSAVSALEKQENFARVNWHQLLLGHG